MAGNKLENKFFIKLFFALFLALFFILAASTAKFLLPAAITISNLTIGENQPQPPVAGGGGGGGYIPIAQAPAEPVETPRLAPETPQAPETPEAPTQPPAQPSNNNKEKAAVKPAPKTPAKEGIFTSIKYFAQNPALLTDRITGSLFLIISVILALFCIIALILIIAKRGIF